MRERKGRLIFLLSDLESFSFSFHFAPFLAVEKRERERKKKKSIISCLASSINSLSAAPCRLASCLRFVTLTPRKRRRKQKSHTRLDGRPFFSMVTLDDFQHNNKKITGNIHTRSEKTNVMCLYITHVIFGYWLFCFLYLVGDLAVIPVRQRSITARQFKSIRITRGHIFCVCLV